ncbi:hypothetical protein [Parvibaculum sp.]|jgi:hypothetical protein|uniref:hypothetical protein n=1 Tax=Parvibaculum sp. TaxID=2024848 RepID=UPI003C723138
MATEQKPAAPSAVPGMDEDAEKLAARLTRLIAREIADLERQRAVSRDEAEGERQARRIATLVRSIDKLNEIEQAARRAKKDDPSADNEKRRAEEAALRISLESRLARLLAAVDEARVPALPDTAGSEASQQ